MSWPLDSYSLMWVQIATGFMGALTLVFLLRVFARRIGWIVEIRPYFSPKGGCTEALVAEIKKARRELLVQAYSFTSDPLTNALVAAKSRGVAVSILLDKSNESDPHSDLKQFLEHKLEPLVDHDHAIAHNKVIIIDGRTVVTGSFNFTNQAEHENAENVLILRGVPEIVAHYRESFLRHKAHSKPAALKAPHDSRERPKKAA